MKFSVVRSASYVVLAVALAVILLALPSAAFAARGVVTGTVTDALTGLPVPGISVNLFDSYAGHYASATTDSSGMYALSPWVGDPYEPLYVSFTDPSGMYAPRVWPDRWVYPEAADFLTIADDTTTTADATLAAGAHMNVYVHRQGHPETPAAGVSVAPHYLGDTLGEVPQGRVFGVLSSALSDASGTAVVGGLAPGEYRMNLSSSAIWGSPSVLPTLSVGLGATAALDVGLPLLPITATDADGAWHNHPVTVELSTPDGDNGPFAIHYRAPWTGTGDAVYTGPMQVTAEGTNRFSAWSTDASGTAGPTIWFEVRIDTVKPQTMSNTDSGWRNTLMLWCPTDPVAGTLHTPDFMNSDVVATYFTIDGGPTRLFDYQLGTYPITSGQHTVTWWSVDEAGNVEDPHTGVIWGDDVPPVTEVQPRSDTDPDAVLVSTDDASGVKATLFSLNGSAVATYTAALKLDPGANTLQFSAVDQVGNIEASQTAQVVYTPLVQHVLTVVRTPSASSLTYRRRHGIAKFTLAARFGDSLGAMSGVVAYLQKSGDGRKWSRLSRIVTTGTGRASLTISAKKTGRTYYRWYAPATVLNTACVTKSQRVTVR